MMRLSISDDDICSECAALHYNPGGQSWCELNFPGEFDPDGYCVYCHQFTELNDPDANWDLEELEE